MSVAAFLLGALVASMLWLTVLVPAVGRRVRLLRQLRRMTEQKNQAVDAWRECADRFEAQAKEWEDLAEEARTALLKLEHERDHWRERAQRAESMARSWPQ